MTQEDRDYFKSGVRTLCGIEVIQIKNIINDPELKVVFTSEDLAFIRNLADKQGQYSPGRLEHLRKWTLRKYKEY